MLNSKVFFYLIKLFLLCNLFDEKKKKKKPISQKKLKILKN